MTVRRATKAIMIYQKSRAMALLVGVNMPPMLMLMPFIVATGGGSQTALCVCGEQLSSKDVLSD
jgi:hypothetical protein